MNLEIRKQVEQLLNSFGIPEENYYKNPPLVIAKKIVDGVKLSEVEAQAVIRFFDDGYDSTEQALSIKARLYGGEAHAKTLRDKQRLNTERVRVEAVAEPSAAIVLGSRTPDVAISMADIGTVNAVGSVTMLQAETALREAANNGHVCDVLNRWGGTFESPDLHFLRRDVLASLTEYDVPFNDEPWTPSTAEQYGEKVRFKVDAIRLMAGDRQIARYPTRKTSEPILASRGNPKPEHQTQLVDQLNQLEQEWLTSVESLIGMAYYSSLDKIGRYISRDTGHGRNQDPSYAAITASREIAERIDIDRLVEPIIRDMSAQVKRRTQLHTSRITGTISRVLRAAIPASALKHKTDAGIAQLERQLKAQIKTVVCREDFEDGGEIPKLPVGLLTAYASVVGGGKATTANTPSNERNESNPYRSVALGAAALTLVDKVYKVWRTWRDRQELPPLREGEIIPETDGPTSTIDDILLASGSITESLQWRWTPNQISIPGLGRVPETHFPAHERFFGRVVEVPEQLSGDIDGVADLGSEPGDHKYCRCAWVAII